jgi:hypothetical protein
VQQFSDSIAKLAAALAKAQGELVNPEKSLVAIIRSEGAAEKKFRYAPLSSGLDIVRKTLGQHEIAVVQTTSADVAAGMINLTTMLAHASGEWIASDWPVCAVSETATPHRMGAALTYARRYALFTLVGIAGEDDLDAPDLAAPTTQTILSGGSVDNSKGNLNGGGPAHQARPHATRHHRSATPVLLEAATSAELRHRLIVEINALGSSDDATKWAQRCMADKNRLMAADARDVEETFRTRLARLAAAATEAGHRPAPAGKSANPRRSKSIDKSALTLSVPRRIRDRDHVRAVAKKPCLICGRRPSDPHHLRFAQSRAMGRKVSDEFTVPLCRGHHREVHRCGDEAAWWKKAGIDPTIVARVLWLQTHPLSKVQQSEAPVQLTGERQGLDDETKPIEPARRNDIP